MTYDINRPLGASDYADELDTWIVETRQVIDRLMRTEHTVDYSIAGSEREYHSPDSARIKALPKSALPTGTSDDSNAYKLFYVSDYARVALNNAAKASAVNILNVSSARVARKINNTDDLPLPSLDLNQWVVVPDFNLSFPTDGTEYVYAQVHATIVVNPYSPGGDKCILFDIYDSTDGVGIVKWILDGQLFAGTAPMYLTVDFGGLYKPSASGTHIIQFRIQNRTTVNLPLVAYLNPRVGLEGADVPSGPSWLLAQEVPIESPGTYLT